MKNVNSIKLTSMVLWMLLLCSIATTVNAQRSSRGGPVTYQIFYDELSPYGTWIDYPGYGQVWHPQIAGDFRPYLTNGYWDYSNEGWMWMSNYDWGWAPFHYGRWLYDDMYGWLWIPGYDWSPAWVTWGMYDNYYAWAPLMPGVNIGVQFGNWRPASFYWNVCDRSRIYDRNISSIIVRRNETRNFINNISVINNFGNTRGRNYYAKGPDLNDVQRYTKQKITPASIREVNRGNSVPVTKRQGNQMQVYRPTVTNPQPREYRRIENNNVNPVRAEGDRINNGREQQQANIERLPVQRRVENNGGNRQQNTGNKTNRGRRN